MPAVSDKLRYSASLVSQGKHRFHTLTMPSDVLASCTFVSTRDEDPKAGFQRLLSRPRAQDIADYIDKGLGTIPTSIILSAQDSADFEYVRKTKLVTFMPDKHAFLIIDGQHRVFGFSLAKAALRVPVVVYNGLSRRDETRLFIDINNKQRPVPNELLLEIKGLAEYESTEEERLRSLFDTFNSEPGGPLTGLLSPMERASGKISRPTFNAAVKPLLSLLSSRGGSDVHLVLSNYMSAVVSCLSSIGASQSITSAIVFKAFLKLFTDVARRVKDRHGADYSQANFMEVLQPTFVSIQPSKIRKPGTSVQALYDYLRKLTDSGFEL